MMSQNRQAAKDRVRSDHDDQINHSKLDPAAGSKA